MTIVFPCGHTCTSDAETHRPIAEMFLGLEVIGAEARETDKALRKILGKIGV